MEKEKQGKSVVDRIGGALKWGAKKGKKLATKVVFGEPDKDPYEEYNQKKYGDKVDTRKDSYMSSGQMGKGSAGGGSSRPTESRTSSVDSQADDRPNVPANIPAAKTAAAKKKMAPQQVASTLVSKEKAKADHMAKIQARIDASKAEFLKGYNTEDLSSSVKPETAPSPQKRIEQGVVDGMAEAIRKPSVDVDKVPTGKVSRYSYMTDPSAMKRVDSGEALLDDEDTAKYRSSPWRKTKPDKSLGQRIRGSVKINKGSLADKWLDK